MDAGSRGLGPRLTWEKVRAPVMVLLVLGVLCSEFLLLRYDYDRTKPVRAQRVTVAQLSGQLQTLGIASAQAPMWSATAWSLAVAGSQSTLVTLHAQGASPHELAALTAATQSLHNAPSSTAFTALMTATNHVAHSLSRDQRRIDDETIASYVLLLVLASLGWFSWFRVLVRRHRRLQRTVTEQQIRAVEEQRLAALVRNASDVVAVLDPDSTITFVTASSTGMLGRTPDALMQTALLDIVDGADHERLTVLLASHRPGAEYGLDLRMNHGDGRQIVAEGVLTDLLHDPAVGGWLLTIRDVTERRSLEGQLSFQAFHDPLTGLANRRLFSDRLQHALTRRSAVTEPLSVLFCDLDDFKNVNDSLGHAVGDQVLSEVSARVGAVVRSGDTAARLGGDEFAVLLEGTDIAAARELAERLQAALAQPIHVEDSILEITVSVGIAQAVPGEVTGDEALRNADVAMYLAKDSGKSAIAIYDSRLHAEALERLGLRADLQRALNEGTELTLLYQPVIELGSGRVQGFEALVRWEHPSKGLLSPFTFVPLAEETGLIHGLGRWVLERACRDGAQLRRMHPGVEMAVNVSALELSRPWIVEQVLEILADTGFPADQLILEITEGAVLRDLEAVAPRLNALRAHGIRVAIDDFGTGYSSLAYLSDLPIDILKVDKSFVDRVTADAQHASVTAAILQMSRNMRLLTVAEGVELPEQAAWLFDARCEHAQGYLWSVPVALAQARGMLDGPLLAVPVPAAGAAAAAAAVASSTS